MLSILIPTIDNDKTLLAKIHCIRRALHRDSIEICLALNSGSSISAFEHEAILLADKAIKNEYQVPPIDNFLKCVRLATAPYCVFSPVDDQINIDLVMDLLNHIGYENPIVDILMLDHGVVFRGHEFKASYSEYGTSHEYHNLIQWLKNPFDFLIYFPMRTKVAEKLLLRCQAIRWHCCSESYLHRRVAFPITLFALLEFNCKSFPSPLFATMSISSGSIRSPANIFNSLSVDIQCCLCVAFIAMRAAVSSPRHPHFIALVIRVSYAFYCWMRYSFNIISNGFMV